MLSKVKRAISVPAALAAVFCCMIFMNVSAAADAVYKAVLVDLDGCIPDTNEAKLTEYMQKTADIIECNIGVVITADLNGMYYKDYADNFGDSNFGTGSSTVVLMLLNSNGNPAYADYVDWISTSGRARDYYDGKTDRIFNSVYDGLDSSGFEEAVKDFCDALVKYRGGSADTFQGSISVDLEGLYAIFLGSLVIGLVMSLIITGKVAAGYTKKVPVSAVSYLDGNRTAVTRKSDVFVKEYIRTYTTSSGGSRGGSSHGGGGGRHRSGGHGGGGGRHR